MEELKPKNEDPLEVLEQKKEVLNKMKEKAKVNNPACADGGCGGMCGTENCSKKIQGILNRINKALRENPN